MNYRSWCQISALFVCPPGGGGRRGVFMTPAPFCQRLVGVFEKLIPPGWGNSDLESMRPDDFNLASIRGDEAVAPPDDEPPRGLDGRNRFEWNTPPKGAEVEDDFFPGDGEFSRQDEPIDRQDKDRRGVEDDGRQLRFFGRLFGKDVAMARVDLEKNRQDDQQNDREHEKNLDPRVILDGILENDSVQLNSPPHGSSAGALFAAGIRF